MTSNTRLYKKEHNREVMNYRLSQSSINRKKIDLIKSLTAMLFDIQFGVSQQGTIRPIQQIERQIEMIAKLNGIPLFTEEDSIISNVFSLIVEIETESFIEEFELKKYLVSTGRRTLMRADLKSAGYNSFTIAEAEKLYTIALKIIHIHKELDRRNYKGIKSHTKKSLDGLQALINILMVND
jgi:hypothetical protein